MPREYLHWALAKKVSRSLKSDSPLKAIIARYNHIFLTGAVILDTPLYFTFGRDSSFFQGISHTLHENREESITPILRLLRGCDKPFKEAAWAFVAGIITHIMADAQFHPMIYYFSDVNAGKNKRRAVTRHRIIETALDILCLTNGDIRYNLLFEEIFKHKEMEDTTFYNLLSRFYDLPFDQIHLIKKAITQHSIIQKLFRKKWPKIILQVINCMPAVYMDDLIALFYSFTAPLKPQFGQDLITYQHPVTGVRCQKRIRDMEEDTVLESLQILQLIDKYWERESLLDAFSQLRIPNMTTGMVGALMRDMKYFNTETNLHTMLYNER